MSRDATGFVGVVAVVRYLVWRGFVGCGFVWCVVGVVCAPDVLGGLVRWWQQWWWCGGWGGCFCGGVGGLLWWWVRPPQRGCCGGRPIVVGPGGGPVGVWVFRWCPTLPLPGGGSTIGAGGLSFRVRYGSGRFPARCGRRDGGGVVVRVLGRVPPPGGGGGWVGSGLRSGRGWFAWCVCRLFVSPLLCVGGLCGVCSCWPISTGRLSPLPGVHLRPIHPVVCWGPSATPVGVVWRPGLGGGFPLRCFQRLPVPNVANQRCPWRDNWRTRGSSVPVLSYWGRVSSSLLRAQRIGTELSHDVLNPARVPL